MKSLYEDGSIHQKVRCWAPGMEGWKTLDQIAQLKWLLVSTGTALLNESELAVLILKIFIRVCGFYPTRYSTVGGGVVTKTGGVVTRQGYRVVIGRHSCVTCFALLLFFQGC